MPLRAPDYELPPTDLSFFRNDLEAQVLGYKRPKTLLQERRRLLGMHGEAATEMLLRQLEPAHNVENMNQVRNNYPGYDFLVDGKLRVQCKGRCWVELIDFALKPLDKTEYWKSDIWITVDFSGFLDGRIGRLEKETNLAPIGRARWFIAPTDHLKEFVRTKCGHMSRIRAQAWRTSAAYRKSAHFPELFEYEDAFHWVFDGLKDEKGRASE